MLPSGSTRFLTGGYQVPLLTAGQEPDERSMLCPAVTSSSGWLRSDRLSTLRSTASRSSACGTPRSELVHRVRRAL